MLREGGLPALIGIGSWLLTAAAACGGDLLVSSAGRQAVLRFNADGAFLGEFASPGEGGLDGPGSMTVGPGDLVYLISFESYEVLRFSQDGSFVDVFAFFDRDEYHVLRDLAFRADGRLFVSDTPGSLIHCFDGVTGTLIESLTSPLILEPGGLATGPDDCLYITSRLNHRIVKYDPVTGLFSVFADSTTQPLSVPTDLAFDDQGLLYVTDAGRHSVYRYDELGQPVEPYFVHPMDGCLNQPFGLAFDERGMLYVSSFDNDRILRYGTDGYFVDTFADRTNSPLAVPWQIAFVAEAPADDTDADGVIDPLDECNNTPHGIPVNERGRPIGDLDADCDADLMDFAIFQACVTGPLS